MRVVFFDQANLPGSIPFLEPLLSLDRYAAITIDFKVNEPVDSILLCKSIDKVSAVLEHAAYQIVGHANVKRSTKLACKDIDEILMLPRHRKHHGYWIARLRGR